MRNYLPSPPPTEIGGDIPPYQLKPYKEMAKLNKEDFVELMKKPTDKIHSANFKETKNGWVKCVKPTGEEYGLIINSLVDDIQQGKKDFVSYDDKTQVLQFMYAKGEGNPFK